MIVTLYLFSLLSVFFPLAEKEFLFLAASVVLVATHWRKIKIQFPPSRGTDVQFRSRVSCHTCLMYTTDIIDVTFERLPLLLRNGQLLCWTLEPDWYSPQSVQADSVVVSSVKQWPFCQIHFLLQFIVCIYLTLCDLCTWKSVVKVPIRILYLRSLKMHANCSGKTGGRTVEMQLPQAKMIRGCHNHQIPLSALGVINEVQPVLV